MKVMVVHNTYQQRGGEDVVFESEVALLRSRGVHVTTYVTSNDDLHGGSPIQLGLQTMWSRRALTDLRRAVRAHRPDVVHFHNTFPRLSPSVYHACVLEGVPVVQTLHNYRLVCPSALCLRDAAPCTACVGRAVPWPGVRYGCYRGSRSASFAVAGMLTLHRFLRTWSRKVDTFIALTEFARHLLIEGGLPAHKVVVKPNFLAEDPGAGTHDGGFALFVGRLSAEKGVETLLQAWDLLSEKESVPLVIVGDGPLAPWLKEHAQGRPHLRYMGPLPRTEVLQLMKDATLLLMPSLWFEGFPMTIVEAFATGLPVIGSNLGGIASVIQDATNGFLVEPGHARTLAERVRFALSRPDLLRRIGRRARADFEAYYHADAAFHQLMGIYGRVLKDRDHAS